MTVTMQAVSATVGHRDRDGHSGCDSHRRAAVTVTATESLRLAARPGRSTGHRRAGPGRRGGGDDGLENSAASHGHWRFNLNRQAKCPADPSQKIELDSEDYGGWPGPGSHGHRDELQGDRPHIIADSDSDAVRPAS